MDMPRSDQVAIINGRYRLLADVMHRQERTLLLDPEADVQRPVIAGLAGFTCPEWDWIAKQCPSKSKHVSSNNDLAVKMPSCMAQYR
jgi:hypothetical protein